MDPRQHRNGAAASAAAATLWIILAWRNPTSTHHFAPLVASGIWGYLTRIDRSSIPTRADRMVMLIGGFVPPAVAQVILTIGDKLAGPPLFSAIPVPMELLIMAGLGAFVGSCGWHPAARTVKVAEQSK